MISVYCPRHRSDVLLGHRQILAIEGEGSGLSVRFVCWCGHEGTHNPRSPSPHVAHRRPALSAA
jgi:hypothetical protein